MCETKTQNKNQNRDEKKSRIFKIEKEE